VTGRELLPRHILMTADAVGGVWTYAIELARSLASRGVHVSLATMGAALAPAQREEACLNGLDLYESAYKLEWMEDPWPDIDAAAQWLLDLERKLQPDLIHLNNFAHGNLRWRAPVVVVGHSCVFSWWNAVRETNPPQEWDQYRSRVREGLQGADAVVCVSGHMLSELERWYGPIACSSIVYNSHDSSAYQPAPKQDLVLSTGRFWDEAKNLPALDEAAALAHWPVYVAGEAQHPEGGRRSTRNVIALGKLSREDLRPWFARASVYALPALYEPFGLSILEAALSGCALILGDIPSLREIWGDAALFVPPTDHEALALGVNSLVWNPDSREELRRRARVRASEFTPDRMVQGYVEAYARAHARRASARKRATSCAS
jgi:glycogen synthase